MQDCPRGLTGNILLPALGARSALFRQCPVGYASNRPTQAIEAAQGKRQELLDAQPAARHSAKVLAALPNAAAAYKRQIEKGLEANPREANKARVILRDLLGPIQMCPGADGSLWAEFDARPAALLKKAVGTSVGSGGSGGRI